MSAYNEHTITVDGYAFAVDIVPDEMSGAPWDNMTTLGDVSKWRDAESKRPGERILGTDRHKALFYQFADAVANGRAQGLSGIDAAASATNEFDYLRRWCNDDWHYVGVVVRCIEFDVDDKRYGASLWGIESDGGAYLEEVAIELAREVISEQLNQVA